MKLETFMQKGLVVITNPQKNQTVFPSQLYRLDCEISVVLYVYV